MEKNALVLRGESWLILNLYSVILLEAYLEWCFQGGLTYGACLLLSALLTGGINLLLFRRIRLDWAKITPADLIALLFFIGLYGSHVLTPELCWDTLNYHIYQQEALLRNPFAFDAFPMRTLNINAFIYSDLVFRPFREYLGYRLGTLPGLLVTGASYFLVKRLLTPLFQKGELNKSALTEPLLSLLAVAAVCADHTVLLIATYQVDTLALPLILEAVAAIFLDEKPGLGNALWLGYLAGMAVSIKISNGFFLLVLAAVWVVVHRKEIRPGMLLGAVGMAVVPVALFLIRGYVYMGNPVFPYVNGIFKSPYFVTDHTVNELSGLNENFGPRTLKEFLLWPFFVLRHPERLSDDNYTTGRLALTFIALFLGGGVGIARKNKRLLGYTGLVFAFYLLYLCVMDGYIRYVAFLDVMGAILIVWILSEVFSGGKGWLLRCGAWGLTGLLLLQTGRMITDNQFHNVDMAGRASVFTMPVIRKSNLAVLGRDRIGACLPEELAESVDIWLAPVHNSGYAVCTDRSIPIYGIGDERVTTPEAREILFNRLQTAADENRRMWLPLYSRDLRQATERLNAFGLKLVQARPFQANFTADFDLMLVECAYAGKEPVSTPAWFTDSTFAEADLSGRDSVTMAVCMNGLYPKGEDATAYSFNVELLDERGGLVERLEPFALAYYDESVQIPLSNLAARGVQKAVISPQIDQLNGRLMIILHD